MEKSKRGKKISEQKDTLSHLKSPIETIKMDNCIAIIGVSHSEILAQGLCPHCKKRLDLWITEEGLELSPRHEKVKVETGGKGLAGSFIKLKRFPSWLSRSWS